MLRNLTSDRKSIGEAMIFCIQNADKAEEIVECLVESLSITETPLNKKVIIKSNSLNQITKIMNFFNVRWLAYTWYLTYCTTVVSKWPTPAIIVAGNL